MKRNGRGPTYWTTCTVHAMRARTGIRIRGGAGDKPLSVWRYQLEPSGDGTDVTESFQLRRHAASLLLGVARLDRGRTNRDGMRTTLEAIKAGGRVASRRGYSPR